MATPATPGRVRKPRPPARPFLTVRIDDATGELFEQSLALVRKRVKDMRTKQRRVELPVWVVDAHHPEQDAVVREETAQTPGTRFFGYLLTILELSDEYLATRPLDVPKHSWMLSISTGGRSMPITQGAAPTHEEARARVEACWRVEIGALSDA